MKAREANTLRLLRLAIGAVRSTTNALQQAAAALQEAETIQGQEAGDPVILVPANATMREAQRIVTEHALQETKGDKAAAARRLGVSRRGVYNLLRRGDTGSDPTQGQGSES